jgi:hypothetical protein
MLSATVTDPDSLQVELQVEAERIGVAFTGTPTGTSDPVASGSTASVTLNSLADGRYHRQARTKDENGDTSRWVSFDTNSDGNQPSVNADVDFRVNVPLAPTALAQQDDASQPLPTGGLTDDPVTLSATVTDPDYATLRLEVEAKRIGVAFDGSNTTTSSAVASGSAASVTLTNLDDGRYHWRARTVDQNGATSGWVSSGSNSDGNQPTTNADIDFRVNAPSDPAGLFQQKPNGSAIAVGNNTDGQGGNNKRSVTLGATTADPDGRDVQLKIQVAQTNKAFSDPGTIEKTSSLAPGGVVSFTFNNGDGLNANQNYHWRARTIDDDGNASRWVPFGGNSDSVTAGTDFRVPQADLSLTKSVLGSSGLTPGDHVNVAASAADLTATHTHTLIVTLGVSNGGPDTAKNVVVTDDVLSIMDNAPAPHQVFDSATYCQLNNPGTSCLSSPVPLPAGGKIAAGDLASGASETFQIFANVSWQVRRGPVTLTNNASAESDVFDPSVATASKNFTVNTIPKFDVQAGNGNAVVSWSPPPLADEAAVNHYRLKITGGPSAITVDPVPTTACTGRNGGTLCYNRTGLTNGTNYTFQLFAVTASSVQRDGSEAQGKPSVDNKAAIVSTTSSSFSTCTTATTKNPICVTMQVPSGGGGVFSVQNAITGYSSFQFTNFCNGSCGLGIGSFEGHPPAGYNNPNNPIQLTVTWDRSAWSGTENSIFYQADSLHGGLPFQLVKCTNQSVDSAFPDPCIKKTNVIGSKNGDNCTLKAACFGDLQAQILLTSAADGGFAKKG